MPKTWLRLMPKLLGDGLGVSRVHEDILEDGGGVVTGEFVEDRLHEVGRHQEEASPGASPGPIGEKSWQGGAACHRTRHSLLGSFSQMAVGILAMSPLCSSQNSLAAVTLRPSGSVSQCKARAAEALLNEVWARPYAIEGGQQHDALAPDPGGLFSSESLSPSCCP